MPAKKRAKTDRAEPTLRGQWLGKQLYDLRPEDMSADDVARGIGLKSSSLLSRWENGERPCPIPVVKSLLNLYSVSDQERRDALITLADEVWRRGWWDGYKRHVSLKILDRAWLEARARSILSFDPLVIHGLLQTPAYAEAVLAGSGAPTERIPKLIDFRVDRQEVLDRRDPAPLCLKVILGESALRRPIVGPDDMREQLAHILAMTDRPNVELGILPASAPVLTSPDGQIAVVRMTHPFPDFAYSDGPFGAVYVEDEDEVALRASNLDRQSESALTGVRARRFLEEIMREAG